ncbi:MAG TPA: hypothetical protein VIX80_05940 [Candidatus Kapabacteria bacterium]
MPRLFFIAVLLVVVAGCGSERQYFIGVPAHVAPIAKTESFYVVDAGNRSGETNLRRGSTLTRLDPDGSITMIREIDPTYVMRSDVSDGNTVVMYQDGGKPPLLYRIATGEVSPTTFGPKHKELWQRVEGHEFDSLTNISFLKDLIKPVIFRLYKPDYYLVQADLGQSYPMNDNSFAPGCFGGQQFYWAIADMKNSKIILRIEDAMPDMSATGRTIFFSVMPPYEKCYPYMVNLEDYLK